MSASQDQRLAAYVLEVWRLSLGRDPDPIALAATVAELKAGADPVGFFLATTGCDEAVRHRAEQQAVPLLFPAGHYYSPIVHPAELAKSGFRDRRSADTLPGLRIDYGAMRVLFETLIDAAGDVPLPEEPGPGGIRYFSRNPMFGVGDAIILSGMVRHLRPRRWIEVGSGFSSAVLLDTLDRTPGLATRLTFIEPYPDRLDKLLAGADRDRATILQTPIQDVPLAMFDDLEAGDVLFLDTTHISKTGSDVNHEVFQILPRLASGVVVHFHDVFGDLEYPDDWIFTENKSWNEQYLLRAFLMFNESFEILYANHGFAHACTDLVKTRRPEILDNPGGGLWLRRRDGKPNQS